MAGIQPTGKWRFFSWHPFLMTIGMIGVMGISAATKKLGGYTNTKVRNTEGMGMFVFFCLLSCSCSTIVAWFAWMGIDCGLVSWSLLYLQKQGDERIQTRTLCRRDKSSPVVSGTD